MALLTTDIVRDAAPRDALSAPLRAYIAVAFAAFAGLAAVHGLAFAAMEPVRWLPAFALYACASTVTGLLLARHFPHGRLGWCNGVTQARLALVAVLLTPLATGAAGGWAIVALALAALALDGVDGWLARRQGLSSAFGARFDMEVDSALALLLALHVFAAGTVGPAILLLGTARYAFVAAGALLPWLARPLPDRFGRKAVCVAQIGALIALQAPIVPAVAAQAVTLAVAAALLWSFGRDAVWLAARRNPAACSV